MLSYFKKLFLYRPKLKSSDRLIKEDYVANVFHNLVTKKKVPGISVTILKNGKQIFQKGYGYADLENKISVYPTKTIFRIASISKCITGLALGKMAEDGILNFDDSFYKYVPYYPKKKYDFTLRQLASHTAGIRNYRGKEYGLNKPYSIKESLVIFKDNPLVFKPGTGYLYNSFDFVLLALAMQEAVGIPFEDYVKEKILVPLKMTATFPPKNHSEALQSVFDTKFYTKTAVGFKKAITVNNFYKLAGGGYLSTSDDIAKLGQAILEQKLLQPETYRRLITSEKVNGKLTYYGLGFQVSKDKYGRLFVGHVGSSVGTYSNLFVYSKEKLVVSILMNCTNPKVQKELDRLINELLNSKFS